MTTITTNMTPMTPVERNRRAREVSYAIAWFEDEIASACLLHADIVAVAWALAQEELCDAPKDARIIAQALAEIAESIVCDDAVLCTFDEHTQFTLTRWAETLWQTA